MNAASRELTQGILFTDFYQLSMAQLYYRHGLHETQVQFDHFFRSYPNYGSHKAGYCVSAGLAWLLEWMKDARFGDAEIACLKTQRSSSGKAVFDEDFLAWLKENGHFGGLSLQAVPEGRVVHANTPLTVVSGPLIMAQILETALLAQINYQTLIATKASRIHDSGRGQLVLEFGMRRAHDFGANAGTRAALIGGAHYSSNTGMSYALGFPPRGTHAHSLVQLFITLGMGELEAFRAYAELYPDDCLLLVDTVDTLQSGVPNAITVFEELKRKGHNPVGVRLDSGDLAYLSIQVAKMLDEAGFADASIVLSNNLDELVIWQIITQISEEAGRYGVDADRLIQRLVYGVGTSLITSAGDAALGGVYKLVAVCDRGKWQPAIKISESAEKTPNPGHKRLWRLYDTRGKAVADLMTLDDEDPRQESELTLRHPAAPGKLQRRQRSEFSELEELLVDVLREGRLVTELPSIERMRERRIEDLAKLDAGVRRLMNPHIYHVSLSQKLWSQKQELMQSVRNGP